MGYLNCRILTPKNGLYLLIGFYYASASKDAGTQHKRSTKDGSKLSKRNGQRHEQPTRNEQPTPLEQRHQPPPPAAPALPPANPGAGTLELILQQMRQERETSDRNMQALVRSLTSTNLQKSTRDIIPQCPAGDSKGKGNPPGTVAPCVAKQQL